MNIDRGSLETGFSRWLLGEHARLHGPGTSAQSHLLHVRRATALPFDHYDNMPVNKTQQHQARLRLRLGALLGLGFGDSFDAEMAGRVTSDSLKLVAGQQVKRMVAQAKSPRDFAQRLGSRHVGAVFALKAVFAEDPGSQLNIISRLDELDSHLDMSLRGINVRAIDGSDWGEQQSEMVESAWLGEVACIQFATSLVDYIAEERGGYEYVPLRAPGEDAAVMPILYPFRTRHDVGI